MEILLEILGELHPEVNFREAHGLVKNSILDSLDIVTLVTEINDRFGVSVTGRELTPENFDSLESMASMIRALGGRI